MGEVVELDASRKHICVSTSDGTVHVFPCAFIESIIDGNTPVMSILAIDSGDKLLKRIIEEWYANLTD